MKKCFHPALRDNIMLFSYLPANKIQLFLFKLAVFLHLRYGAFPDHKAADALVLQRFPDKLISADVVIELLLPELNPAFRHINVLASAVPMPVTAMNEDGDLIFRKIDVGMTEHAGVVLPVAETLMVQQLAKVDLRLCIFALDCGHIPASAFRADRICHYAFSISLTKATKRPSVQMRSCRSLGYEAIYGFGTTRTTCSASISSSCAVEMPC